VPAVDHWFRESERVWDSAHHQLQRALHRHRRTADLRRSDPPAFQPGQKVWLAWRQSSRTPPPTPTGRRNLLQDEGDPGLPAPWRPTRVPGGLGGLRSGRTLMGCSQ
ncbi:hypothetical protein QTP70_006810, partial [Hemibagrus guttatus]